MNRHQISSDTIILSTIEDIIKYNKKVELSDSAKQKVQNAVNIWTIEWLLDKK